MSQNAKSPKTFIAGEALEAFRRVKLDASVNVVNAGAGEDAIGITTDKVASGEPVAVDLRGYQTFKVVAASAFALGASLYGAANGKVDDAVSGSIQFIALEAATADGDIVEALAKI